MKRSKILVSATAAAILLAAGAIGVRAAPTCVQIVKVVRDRAVHHVSKETAARWALWGKEHPNYRPKKRKPLSPEESLRKVVFACQIPLSTPTIAGLLPPVEETSYVPSVEEPVYVALATPVFTLVGTPLESAPLAPTDDLPTPEPSTFVLLGSALALLAYWKRDRFFNSASAAPALSVAE